MVLAAASPFVTGLGGICPGPGLVARASLQPQAFVFIAAMLVRQHCIPFLGLLCNVVAHASQQLLNYREAAPAAAAPGSA